MRVELNFKNEYQERVFKGMALDKGCVNLATLLRLIWADKFNALSETEKLYYLKLADKEAK